MKLPIQMRVPDYIQDDFNVFFDQYDQEKNEMRAHTEDGEEIKVDPFVGCAWEWHRSSDLVGKMCNIKGYWCTCKLFIVEQGKLNIIM